MWIVSARAACILALAAGPAARYGDRPMDLNAHVFDYCERGSDAGLLAEPLDAASNAAFLYFAWRLWAQAARQGPELAPKLRWLAALLGLVGLASLSFHTLATVWASILDVLFIGVFNVSFLIIYLRHVARWPWIGASAAGAAFVLADRAAGAVLPAGALNGSLLYLPATIVLLALTGWALASAPACGRAMARAAAVFAVSLLARTADRALCSSWPWGTHFVWHLLNAWVLYELALALTLAHARALPAGAAAIGTRAL